MPQPYKGPRALIGARPSIPFAEVLEANAKALGMPKGEYLVMLAAQQLNMPEYAPKPKRDPSAQPLDIPEEAHTAAA
jgi:hypothetical protein